MLAVKIRQYRIENGLTQKELAERLNSSQNTISNYEKGIRTPTVKKLLEIANLLGCSVMDLTAEKETQPKA